MPRYVALLRGVSPLNAKMPELKRCFESLGFTDVVTALSSGNVVFDARKTREALLESRIEAALEKNLGRAFPTIVRTQKDLQALLAADPFQKTNPAPRAKRVVTFLKKTPTPAPRLPIQKDGVQILSHQDKVVCSAYLPHAKGPMFMILLEKTFGSAITTRTWDTIRKVAEK